MDGMIGGLLAEADVTTILQFLFLMSVLLVPMVLFAAYKFVSNKRRHLLKLTRLEKGLAGDRGPSKGPQWCRSIYFGVFFCIVSGFFAYGFFEEEIESSGLVFAVFLGLGGLFLTRGLLSRANWIKQTALQNGVPFEKVFPILPRRSLWVTSFAVGLPLLIFAGYLYNEMRLDDVFDSNDIDVTVLGITFCFGAAFFLRGILLAWYLGREDTPAQRKETPEPVLSESA